MQQLLGEAPGGDRVWCTSFFSRLFLDPELLDYGDHVSALVARRNALRRRSEITMTSKHAIFSLSPCPRFPPRHGNPTSRAAALLLSS